MAPRRANSFGSWYKKVAAFKVEDLFSRHRTTCPPRTVYVNQPLPEHYFTPKAKVKKEYIYATNQVITSKYTIITFLPRNLLEQFRRVANVFFLALAILQFFHQFSTISPGLVILPLLIVIGFTAIKDGYEDIKRHQSDRQVNHTPIRVLTGGRWANYNAMEPKSKTFTRGILPKKRKGLVTIEAQRGMSDVESEPELDNYEDDTESVHQRHSLRHPNLFHHDDGRSHWHHTIWEDVKVGDFVKILDNEPIPADILICATSEEENVAFVETKNLDGETNLKSRNAVEALTHLRTAAVCASEKNAFHIDCDSPDVNMYKMSAAVDYRGTKYPVDLQETLLRGTVLRNTKWVIGIVLFTGEETKIVMNSGGTPSKRSKVERQMNPQVFINLGIMACMAVACAIVDAILEQKYFPLGAPWLYGAILPDDNPRIDGLITWAYALITFQNIVPISLYISIEFVRICQAAFIYFDVDIMYDKTGQPTIARTWNLSDDLGQIEYIFSDKTGTLTQNLMVFRQCSINGKVYAGDSIDEEDDHYKFATDDAKIVDARFSSSTGGTSTKHSAVPDPMAADTVKMSANRFVDADLNADIETAQNVSEADSDTVAHLRQLNGFFSVLALCHSVITSVDPITHAIEYKAQSPDEAALVQAAADVGFVFLGRDREILRLRTPFSQDIEEYELLNILEFTSARKRMSVLLRRRDGEDNRVFLLCKGADNVIFERLKEGNQELKDITEKHLDLFANEGLRTLTLAYKVVPDEEYNSWSEKYHKAEVSLQNREDQIEIVSDLMERDLRLLGATAIEDRLQDGVPETIADLKKAGIKIWVATGDKLETAIAIGHSTNLIGDDSNIIIVRGGDERSLPVYQQMLNAVEEFFPESNILEEHSGAATPGSLPRYSFTGDQRPTLARNKTGLSDIVGVNNGDRPGGFVLVVDGSALSHAFADDTQKDMLLRLAMLCEGVICCRVSPLQKALVVKLVKDGLGAMTLAIGDGANDVSMIQAADVGVGISGEEGLQAVNSSDYAIAQFRFLKKLILVHGHWSYARNGNMILNFFYKNVVCVGVLWWFQIYDAWSSNYAFEYTYILFWNSFWTIAPVIGIGVFDRFVDYHVLMQHPQLYRFGREGTWFNMKLFVVYMFEGLLQSTIIYFIINYAYFPSPTARSDGYQIDLYEFTSVMAISAVMVANLFNGLNTAAWTGWVFFAVWIGTVLIWAYTAIYSVISPGWFSTFVYGNDSLLFPSAYFWFGMIITIVLSLLPRYLYKAYKSIYDSDDIDILRYNHKHHPERIEGGDSQYEMEGLKGLKRTSSMLSGLSRSQSVLRSRASSVADGRPSFDPRMRSRTDMSTGLRSVNRGFDFAEEERGVAMRRMQSNLSEVRNSSRHLVGSRVRTSGEEGRARRGTRHLSHIFTIRKGKGLMKRKSEKKD